MIAGGRIPAIGRALTIIILAAAGGFVFRLLHFPLPWTLGAMTVAAIIAIGNRDRVLPSGFRDAARPVIGVMAGSAFSPAVLAQFAAWWPIFVVLLVFFLGVSAAGYVFFRRLGFDRATAFLSASPGGLGEMALLGQQFRADVRTLVLVHSVRIVLVVTLVPFLLRQMLGLGQGAVLAPPGHGPGGPLDWLALSACVVLGYGLGHRLRGYGGLMLVPMLFSAVLHGSGVTAAQIPYAIVAAMQVLIGCITGARFAGIRFHQVWRTLLIGLVWTLVLIAMSVALAALLAQAVDIPAAALFLSFAPGGFAEMSVIAYAARVEVAFVVTCHAFRTIYIMLVSPILCRRLLR